MGVKFKPHLPGLLTLIADETSIELAIKVATKYGGTQIYIAKNILESSELAVDLGFEDAINLQKCLGSGQVLIPKGNFSGEAGRRQQIAMALDQGLTHDQVAKKLDVHIRTVERVARKTRGKKNIAQFDLFAKN